jgi:hypothetical protein
MVASLLKVISTGVQDERLHFSETLYPYQKTWLKTARFTTKWHRLDFYNPPTFGNTAFLNLPRKGHLITRLYLVATMPDIYTTQLQALQQLKTVIPAATQVFPRFGWTNSLGHALVSQLTLDIAASRVETLDSRLLEILDEFNTPLEKVPGVNDLICRKDSGFTETAFGWPAPSSSVPVQPSVSLAPTMQQVVVPLPFWFARGDPGSALPIDAMTMDEVRVGITFRALNGLYYTPTQVPNVATADGTSLYPITNSLFYAQDPVVNPNQQPIANQTGQIKMPPLQLGDCYIMAEYVYLDQNEANRFRLADLQVPIVQHYQVNPFDTRGLMNARIRLDIPNPTRDLFFMCNPIMAPSYNAHFLATNTLRGTVNSLPTTTATPWWPDAIGLNPTKTSAYLRPAFALSNAEPLSGYELDYQGSLVRVRTEGPALFRSIIPSLEQRKSPWVNRYYYNIPLGIENGLTPFSRPQGEANLDKITNRDLVLNFKGQGTNVNQFIVYAYAETYNMLRIYGGRAAMLFAI